jgi:hypothetical protein
MTKFVNDYNTIKRTFPDCTYIVLGSHACQCFRQIDIDTLVELGAPSSTISSWTDNSTWREFVLVGKPGLGSGNSFGWAYENYPTNSGAVAHLNFGLPIKAKGELEFDGTDDYISAGDTSVTDFGLNDFTIECIVKIDSNIPVSTGYYKGIVMKKGAGGTEAGFGLYFNTGYGKFLWSTANGSSNSEIFSTNTWNSLKGSYAHVVMVRQNGATNNGHFYINGVYESLSSAATVLNVNNDYNLTIGASSTLYSPYFFLGQIPVAKIYNRALTSQEVKQNYQQYKTRFNLS